MLNSLPSAKAACTMPRSLHRVAMEAGLCEGQLGLRAGPCKRRMSGVDTPETLGLKVAAGNQALALPLGTEAGEGCRGL
eukprot:9160768-Alexandrium_andersonii.AAC.1